jgi:hypothetical protein
MPFRGDMIPGGGRITEPVLDMDRLTGGRANAGRCGGPEPLNAGAGEAPPEPMVIVRPIAS